jgi:hypothetical protein
MLRPALALGLSLLLLPACSGSVAAPSSDVDVSVVNESARSAAIINGEDCTEEEYPTAMALYVEATISFGGFGEQQIRQLVCTGTLIAPDVVLTAAHCLDASALTFGLGEILEERYFASFDADVEEVDTDPTFMNGFPEGVLEAAGFVRHEDFELSALNAETVNGPGNFYDIGLVFLAEPITDVVPAIVIAEDEESAIVEQAPVGIAGWGQQVVGGGNPFEPPEPGTVGYKVCAESFINEIGEFEMQVGGDETTSRKCHGDSGGPTYIDIDGGGSIPRRVIGVTSHAYDGEGCVKGGVDTRVDAWREWIEAEMQTGCTDEVRSWCVVPGILTPEYVQDVLADGVPVGVDYTGLALNELQATADGVWMELYNGSEHELPPSAVSWRVGDGEAVAIAEGEVVAVDGFLRVDLGVDLADGDELAIAVGGTDYDVVTFDAAVPENCSLARVPDGADDLLETGAPTPGASNGASVTVCQPAGDGDGDNGGDGDGDGVEPAPLLPGCSSQALPTATFPWSAAVLGLLLVAFRRRRD